MPKQKKYIALRSITLWQRAEFSAPTFKAAMAKAKSKRTKWATTDSEDADPVILDMGAPLVLGPQWGPVK